MSHKAGFVNIIGRPNVGKSSMMNAILGEKLSIITPKAQTTRHRILGLLNSDDYQIVFSDTPGILSPSYKLQESMMRAVEGSFEDADVFLYVSESGERNPDEAILRKMLGTGVPIIVVVNKIDASSQEQVAGDMIFWQQQFPGAEVIPISAMHKFNLEKVLDAILSKLPESPAYYDKDDLTDRHMRFIVTEVIREKILLLYNKEIPYSTEVYIEEYTEEPKIDRIRAIIYVERDSQKPIIIGKGGKMLKKVGSEARLDLETFLGKKVFLELNVKVNPDWRNNERMLKQFGYEI